MKVKLIDIIDAIEMMDQYTEYFLDKETGEIEWVSDMAMTLKEQEEIYDRLDEHCFYRLPTSFDIRDYDIMCHGSSRAGLCRRSYARAPVFRKLYGIFNRGRLYSP